MRAFGMWPRALFGEKDGSDSLLASDGGFEKKQRGKNMTKHLSEITCMQMAEALLANERGT